MNALFRQVGAGPLFLAALSGLDLVLVQYFLVREATAALFANEATALLVVACFFLSFSVGYALGPRLGDTGFRTLGWAVFAAHVTFPVSLRALAAASIASGWPSLNLVAVPLVLVLGGCVWHAALLTRLAAGSDRHGWSIRTLYAADLAGAALGVASAAVLVGHGLLAAWTLHLAVMATLMAGIPLHRLTLVVGVGAAALYVALAGPPSRSALEYFGAAAHDLEGGARLLSSELSPYSRVDVFESSKGERFLFLDSILYFGYGELADFNENLVGRPALAVSGGDALVIGAGSMASVGILAPSMRRITTCEIDRAVARAGETYFKGVNRLDDPAVRARWNLVIDDGRHFLRTTGERYELIAFDVPSPATIQLALLASPEVLALARDRLEPGGIVSMSASGVLIPGMGYPHAVLAGFLETFPDVVYLEQRGHDIGYLYGGADLTALREHLSPEVARGVIRLEDREELARLGRGRVPVGLANLGPVREVTRYRLEGRYGNE